MRASHEAIYSLALLARNKLNLKKFFNIINKIPLI